MEMDFCVVFCAIVMLHVLHVTQIIEVLLYIEALHVKALYFKANCMDFFKIKDLFGRPMVVHDRKELILFEENITNNICSTLFIKNTKIYR